MLDALKKREAAGNPIRVGLIGAGAMGRGIAWQVAHTPGMELVLHPGKIKFLVHIPSGGNDTLKPRLQVL